MYISDSSGHHSASVAIEKAFGILSDNIEVKNVNSFYYTNPILEKLVNRAYMGVIRRTPEVWGYLYDNPKIVQRTQKLRNSIHRYNSQKTQRLLEDFKPDAIICTQAFPCGVIADYKKTSGSEVFLSGVLTDYAPHSYWLYDNVDLYFVPSEKTRERFLTDGIRLDKIQVTGIPIDPKFNEVVDRKSIIDSLKLSHKEPVILIMGGSQGVGPIRDIIRMLERCDEKFQMVVVSGHNKRLHSYLKKAAPRLVKKTIVFGYAENIDALMEISSLIITKPGGITVSEALAKSLPLLIIKPIPGQEQMNTNHLIENKVAIRINNIQEGEIFVKELLSKPEALSNIQRRAREFSRPNSALDIAKTVLERIG